VYFSKKEFLDDRRVEAPCHDSDKGWCIIGKLDGFIIAMRCPDGFVIPILHDFLYGVIRNLRSRASGKCVIVECSGT
jgi:hypothetical protein